MDWALCISPTLQGLDHSLGVPDPPGRVTSYFGVKIWVHHVKLTQTQPIGSMYGIYGNIYHQYTPNVSIYTIHGSYGR